jgi:RimJ/RimL family protein N-acetyltransferase
MRPLEGSDVSTIAQWFVDLDDLSLFDRALRAPLNLSSSEKAWSDALGNNDENGKYWFALIDETDSLVGISGIEGLSVINRDGVIPLFIRRGARNKGVGARALALMLDIAFIHLGLKRLTSYFRSDNAATRKLVERLGFRQEGCMRQAWFAKGQHLDMIVIGILRQEWMERRKELATELTANVTVTFGRESAGTWRWPPVQLEGGA